MTRTPSGRPRVRTVGALALVAALAAGTVGLVGPAGAATGKPGPQVKGVGTRIEGRRSRRRPATPRTGAHELGRRRHRAVLREPVERGQGQRWCHRAWRDRGRGEGRRLRPEPDDGGGRARRRRAAAGQPHTGQPGNWVDNFHEYDEVYQYLDREHGTYQTLGPQARVRVRRGDAAPTRPRSAPTRSKVIQEKPFIVIDASNQSKGAPVFEVGDREGEDHRERRGSELADRRASSRSRRRTGGRRRATAPRRVYLVSSFLARSLSGTAREVRGRPRAAEQEARRSGSSSPRASSTSTSSTS